MIQAFRAANDVLLGAVQGIADLIVRPGLINVDFADVRTVMSRNGPGDDGHRRRPAATTARRPPPRPRSATRCSTTSTCPAPTASWSTSPPARTSPCAEFDEVGRTIEDFASEDATVVIGTVLDPDMQDEVRVTVVATGLNRSAPLRQAASRREPAASCARSDRAPVKLVRNGSTGLVEYDAMAGVASRARRRRPGPAPRRRRRAGIGAPAAGRPAEDYLDIPAFLRRQAD